MVKIKQTEDKELLEDILKQLKEMTTTVRAASRERKKINVCVNRLGKL